MPALAADVAQQRFAEASRAVLGTHGPEGRVDLVPVTFAVVAEPDGGAVVVHAVDHKPKATRRLQRLVNLERHPAASLVVDHYDDDWGALWWVRAEGRGQVTHEPPASWVASLVDKYPAYRRHPPAGPFVAVAVQRWTGWSAT